jgi:UDPglucose--hexose-1-phosphate uridylyltransferase
MCDIVARERAEAVRVLSRNRTFMAYVPFAARFPFEVHLVAHRHAPSLLDLSDPERYDLAALLRTVIRAYDERFGFRMPYVLSIHQAPTVDGPYLDIAHLHIELTPRIEPGHLASSEIGAGVFINDLAPEAAAGALRAVVT